MSPEQFVAVLAKDMKASGVVAGQNYRFGEGRRVLWRVGVWVWGWVCGGAGCVERGMKTKTLFIYRTSELQ